MEIVFVLLLSILMARAILAHLQIQTLYLNSVGFPEKYNQ